MTAIKAETLFHPKSPLLLIDSGGSMAPFRVFYEAIIKATGATRLYYFHNVPYNYVYQDSARLYGVSLAELHPICYDMVIIFSDAGAARRNCDSGRILRTKDFLAQLSPTPTMWLNPLPSSRWSDTSADQIARMTTMVNLDHVGINEVNVIHEAIHTSA